MADDKLTFEEALSALEKAASDLRKDNISLEEAIKIFEDGTKLYEKCAEMVKCGLKFGRWLDVEWLEKRLIEIFSKE